MTIITTSDRRFDGAALYQAQCDCGYRTQRYSTEQGARVMAEYHAFRAHAESEEKYG